MEEMRDPLDNLDASSDEYEDDDIGNNTENYFEGGVLLHTQNDREQDAMASDYDIIDGTNKKRSYVHRVRPRKKSEKTHAFNKQCDAANIHKVATIDCCERSDAARLEIDPESCKLGQTFGDKATLVDAHLYWIA